MKPSSESLTIVAPPFPWESEEFLNPAMPNDELLQYDFDDDSDVEMDDNINQRNHTEANVPYSQYLDMKLSSLRIEPIAQNQILLELLKTFLC